MQTPSLAGIYTGQWSGCSWDILKGDTSHSIFVNQSIPVIGEALVPFQDTGQSPASYTSVSQPTPTLHNTNGLAFSNGVTAPSLAASGLAAGQCVQTTTGGLLSTTGSGCASTYTPPPHVIAFPFGTPGGPPLSTGVLGYFTVPFACTIQGWSIQVDTGTATVKWWKVASGTAVPTSSNSISVSGVSLSTGTVVQSTNVTDFTTTTVSAGDIISADLSAVSGAGYVAPQLVCQ